MNRYLFIILSFLFLQCYQNLHSMTPEENYQLGMQAKKAGNINEAKDYFREARKGKHTEAIFELAKIFYYEGNMIQARLNFKFIAKRGHIGANYYMGIMLYNGEGGNEDKEKAKRYLIFAADQGNFEAKYYLIQLLLDQENHFADDYKIIKYFETPVFDKLLQKNIDYQDIINVIILLLLSGEQIHARIFFEKLANLGDQEAQYYFGSMLYDGEGGKLDKEKGIQYLKLAADQGYKHAISKLERLQPEESSSSSSSSSYPFTPLQSISGGFFSDSLIDQLSLLTECKDKKFKTTLEILRRATDEGNRKAREKLVQFYFGEKRTLEEIEQHFNQLGGHICPFYLAWAYHNNFPSNIKIKDRISKAKELYASVTGENYAEAQYQLGFLILETDIEVESLAFARECFEKASKTKHYLGYYLKRLFTVSNLYNIKIDKYDLSVLLEYFQTTFQTKYYPSINKRIIFPNRLDLLNQYQKLARKNNPEGFYQLGEFYYSGIEFPRNPALARVHWRRAEELGHADAMVRMGELFLRGEGVLQINDIHGRYQNDMYARYCFDHAVRQNYHPMGQLYLARLRLREHNPPQREITRAIETLHRLNNIQFQPAQRVFQATQTIQRFWRRVRPSISPMQVQATSSNFCMQ